MKTIQESGLDEAVIVKILGSLGRTENESVIIIHGEGFSIERQAEWNVNPTPDCSGERCEEVRTEVSNICRINNWPPGTPVLVLDGKESVCICYCFH